MHEFLDRRNRIFRHFFLALLKLRMIFSCVSYLHIGISWFGLSLIKFIILL